MTHDVAVHVHNPDPPINPQTFNSPWLIAGVVEKVKELWGTHTALQIAETVNREFGTKLTRASVTGKLDRLGLLNKITIRRTPEEQQARKKERDAAHNIARRARRGNEIKLRIVPPSAPTPMIEEAAGIDLLELTDDTCRWPLGEFLPYVFCGHPPATGLPYCKAHCAIAYRPMEVRRRP